ncbi:Utp30 [Kluyveromyces lactis]|nr:Utp30 [Kluyveromyces lactis]
MPIELDTDGATTKALRALTKQCEVDPKLANDTSIHLIVNTQQPVGIRNDHVPRIIPLKHSQMKSANDVRILLVCKDPSTLYRDSLTKEKATAELFKEIISVKKLKQRFRGKKLKELYNEFDVIVADYRVHHLLPSVLGSTFYHSNRKLPFVVRMSKQIKEKGSKMKEDCDPKYVKAQVKSICKNTWFLPNKDNCLSIKIGEIGVHAEAELIANAEDVIDFLCDRSKKPQGGCIKDGKIASIFVKTSNSVSLPIWKKPEQESIDDDEEIRL